MAVLRATAASVLLFAVGFVALAASKSSKPALVEKIAKRLVQLDVTISGPPGSSVGLGPEDFELRVAGKEISSFSVDAACAQAGTSQAPVEPPGVAARPGGFLFYFDQTQMTPAGRERSISLARDLIPRLVA